MVDAEIQYQIIMRREEIERTKRRNIRKDETLDKRRYINFKRKYIILITLCRQWICIQLRVGHGQAGN